MGFDRAGNSVDPEKRNCVRDRTQENVISDYCKKLTPEVVYPALSA